MTTRACIFAWSRSYGSMLAVAGIAVAISAGPIAAAPVANSPVGRESVIHLMHWIATAIEVVGVAVIVLAALLSTFVLLRDGVNNRWEGSFRAYRANLGRGILLGLEFLVAADIIGTVAVTPTFRSLGVLGLIVLIRTFLSFSLEVEIEGEWPWRRRESERAHPGGERL